MKIFFLFTFIHVELTYIVMSTAQTDLGLRSRTFSLKINKFLKSLKRDNV